MTSHTKTFLRFAVFTRIAVRKPCMIHAKKFVSRAHGSSHPFKKKNNKLASQVKLSVWKKLPAVHKGQAICSKKIGSRADGSRYPFKNNYPCNQLRLSVWKQLPSHSLRRTCQLTNLCFHDYNYRTYPNCKRCLQTSLWMVMVLLPLLITLDYDTRFYSRLTLI